jgi:hypothetical protein
MLRNTTDVSRKTMNFDVWQMIDPIKVGVGLSGTIASLYGRCLWINRNLLYHFSFYLYCGQTSNFATWSGLNFKTNEVGVGLSGTIASHKTLTLVVGMTMILDDFHRQCFSLISFRFVFVDFVSFRFYFVSHFIGTPNIRKMSMDK